MKFVGRTRELHTLETFCQSPTAGLLILFGRRRIGKTRLLTYFLEQHSEMPAFYWMATTHNEAYQLRDFSQTILQFDPHLTTPPHPRLHLCQLGRCFNPFSRYCSPTKPAHPAYFRRIHLPPPQPASHQQYFSKNVGSSPFPNPHPQVGFNRVAHWHDGTRSFCVSSPLIWASHSPNSATRLTICYP